MRTREEGIRGPRWVGFASVGLLCLQAACFSPEQDPEIGGTTGSETGSSTSGSTTGPGTSGTSATATTTGPTTTSATVTSGTDATSAGSSTGEPLPACVENEIDPPTGSPAVTVDTAPLGDDTMGSCGGLSTPDAAYQWTAPLADHYILDTETSDFDTVLYILDDCEGTELACNDNGPDGIQSRIVRPFAQDETVVVVVDGAAGESGNAVLNIEPVSCPSADLAGQALPSTFSNAGGDSSHGGVCGGDGQPERSFRFTPEEAGLYSFRAQSDAFETAVYLEDGPLCGEPEFQCNSTLGTESSEVIRALTAGQSVTLLVDSQGGTGEFTLDVVDLSETCPFGNLDTFGTAAGDINTFPHVMTTSCGPAGDTIFGGVLPSATYSWTSPAPGGGVFGCDFAVETGFPASVSVQYGTCDGPEIECAVAEDGGSGRYQAFVSSGDIDGQVRTLTITPTTFMLWTDADFTVDVICAIT